MLKRIVFLIFLGVGVFILVQVIMPLISYKYWEATDYKENIALVSPINKNQTVLGISVKNNNDFPALYSNQFRNTPAPYKDFKLFLPAINLTDIEVKVDTNDFERNLAHLPGSALPGEKGNVFITGHSSLPQFFKPTNYKAIFSNLPKVKKGDSIILDAGGQRFIYKVIGLNIVDPSEVWVINPPDSTGRYLSLMTCVPPGLYLKRLIVLASLD